MAEDSQPKTLYVVDPRRPRVFRYLQERFKDNPDVEIVIDRRKGERRTGGQLIEAHRRRADRRGDPPDLSATPGFVMFPANERQRPK